MTSLETCIREAVEKSRWQPRGERHFWEYRGLQKDGLYIFVNEHRGRVELISKYEILLDPLFWQALGRARGWDKEPFIINGAWLMADSECELNWFRFIDHLAQGKDAESFFAAL
jgi:hypothetical protein